MLEAVLKEVDTREQREFLGEELVQDPETRPYREMEIIPKGDRDWIIFSNDSSVIYERINI